MSDSGPRRIVIVDCGSTSTKAILIERQQDEYRLMARGEAPTTVEAPAENVMIGLINALRELELASGRHFVAADDATILRPASASDGTDLFLATSSAGGGLQMLVMGLITTISAESGARAALGAGAIVIETLSIDDGLPAHLMIERIRACRPDILLLTGGIDGGNTRQVLELAEMLAAARPRSRFSGDELLPLIFAGNRAAWPSLQPLLEPHFTVHPVDNVRPEIDRENPAPVRAAVQQIFLEHVMSHAPGYAGLKKLVDHAILPTPAGVGEILQRAAAADRRGILCVDIGGATTDVFTVVNGRYAKSVSANLGVSYSMGNVLKLAGLSNIRRWLDAVISDEELENHIGNKMIRPTTIPATEAELNIEQACAREALRLAWEAHQDLMGDLHGGKRERGFAEALTVADSRAGIEDIDFIIGSGGVLSHAPQRAQAALMLIDAFQPVGITELGVDAIFFMPHLGVLATRFPHIALEVFRRDCLIPLGHCVAPRGALRQGVRALTVEVEGRIVGAVDGGEFKTLALVSDRPLEIELRPAPGLDIGQGSGVSRRLVIDRDPQLILDARGRPFSPRRP
jgi:uncharacterized protein (TIGR01319 family)